METKQKRTKVKVILSIILPVLIIMGTLAVSGHAGKPDSPPGLSKPKPEPVWVSVSGAIVGEGAPEDIAIAFSEIFEGFDEDGLHHDEFGQHVANPDYPPALEVGGPGINRSLSYYYCTYPDHDGSGICTNPDGDGDGVGDHDPYYYKCLTISGGKKVKKTDQIVFSAGSRWRISWKVTMGTIFGGILDEPVIYKVLEWSTP